MTGTLDGAPRLAETAVTVSVSAGTASTGDFAAVQNFTLTIAAGQASGTATFRLTPVDDAIDEDAETVRVSGTVQGLTVTAGTVTVEDDDEQGVTVSPTTLSVPEGAGRTYTVVLGSQPSDDVTVTPSATGSADVTVSGALTFTAADWDQAQTVTVAAAQDADAANDTATVSHTMSGGGYGSMTASDVAVTVRDDTSPPGPLVEKVETTAPPPGAAKPAGTFRRRDPYYDRRLVPDDAVHGRGATLTFTADLRPGGDGLGRTSGAGARCLEARAGRYCRGTRTSRM